MFMLLPNHHHLCLSLLFNYLNSRMIIVFILARFDPGEPDPQFAWLLQQSLVILGAEVARQQGLPGLHRQRGLLH